MSATLRSRNATALYFRGRAGLAALAIFAVAVMVFPFLVQGRYPLGLGILAGCTAVCIVGLILLLGHAEQLAVGQGGFSLIGGYVSAILSAGRGWDPFIAMAVGALLSALLAYVVGRPILKLRGYALAMASLALHLMLIVVALELSVTGGAMGIVGIPRFAVLGHQLTTDRSYYFFVWFLVFLAVLIGLNIERSLIGRALRAIAANEVAAASVGIDTAHYKLLMLVISSVLASISGSLTVHFLRTVDPGVFGFDYDLNLLTAAVVGGLGSVWGGAVGASSILGLRELLRSLGLPLWEAVIMGSLTVVMLILFPRGIVGFIGALTAQWGPRSGLNRGTPLPPDPKALPMFPAVSGVPEVLCVKDAKRSFGSLKAVNHVSFSVPRGSVTALIGPNGAGKTTIFNLIGGQALLDGGAIFFGGQRVERLRSVDIARMALGRTFQGVQLFDNMTVLENVMCGEHRLSTAGIVATLFRLPSLRRQEGAFGDQARRCLRFVGLQEFAEAPPNALSFGHQRVLEIARALALQPCLLLMDEPASGLNDTETERLAELIVDIGALGVTILLIEHDMRLVMGLADRIVVMDHGAKIAEGPPDQIRQNRDVIEAYLGFEADASAS